MLKSNKLKKINFIIGAILLLIGMLAWLIIVVKPSGDLDDFLKKHELNDLRFAALSRTDKCFESIQWYANDRNIRRLITNIQSQLMRNDNVSKKQFYSLLIFVGEPEKYEQYHKDIDHIFENPKINSDDNEIGYAPYWFHVTSTNNYKKLIEKHNTSSSKAWILAKLLSLHYKNFLEIKHIYESLDDSDKTFILSSVKENNAFPSSYKSKIIDLLEHEVH